MSENQTDSRLQAAQHEHCPECKVLWYGPVSFCPFCGASAAAEGEPAKGGEAKLFGAERGEAEPEAVAVAAAESTREAEKREAEKREAEKREAERREAERREAERREAEKREAERREAEKREAESKPWAIIAGAASVLLLLLAGAWFVLGDKPDVPEVAVEPKPAAPTVEPPPVPAPVIAQEPSVPEPPPVEPRPPPPVEPVPQPPLVSLAHDARGLQIVRPDLTAPVPLHDQPSTQRSRVVASLPPGTEVTVTGRVTQGGEGDEEWVRVSVAGRPDGYLWSHLLTAPPPPTPRPPQVVVADERPAVQYVRSELTTSARVRSHPSSEWGEVLVSLPPGSEVQVTGRVVRGGEGDWARISVPGHPEAYIARQLLTPDAPVRHPTRVSGRVGEISDTATLVVDGRPVILHGIAPGTGEPYVSQMRAFIQEQGNTLDCTHVSQGRYRCQVRAGDLAEMLLLNGAGRAASDAPSNYLDNQRLAQDNRRGIWAR